MCQIVRPARTSACDGVRLNTLAHVRDSPWPPPTTAPVTSSGWYRASDRQWYLAATPPAPDYALAPDGIWRSPAEIGEPWRASRWGLGDIWWAVLVYLVLGTVVGVIASFVIASTDPDMSFSDVEFGPYSIGIFTIVGVAAFAGVPWIASRRKGLGRLADDFGLQARPVDLPIGFGLGVAGLIAAGLVGVAIDRVLGADEGTSNIPVDALGSLGQFVVFLVAVGVVTPIIEELFFRGLVYRSVLKRGASTATAIAVTTAIFVVPHLTAVSDWRGAVSLFGSIAVLGATFNLACHLTGNRLAAPIVAHMVINCTATLVLYLA